ncbi:MAG: putative metalloprotease CJM1_0395 family protein [Sulfurimonas sp.]|nr:putative metalloprotease CJM1_0395 family protein [Sulfurimonas sp.]
MSSAYTVGSYHSLSQSKEASSKNQEENFDKNKSTQDDTEPKNKEAEKKKAQGDLSVEELQMVQELQARDTEVRAHEAAHQSAGASTGGASFSYQEGPDGKMYAIGGEVSISFKSGQTSEETIQNAQAVIAAAMAPANPSPQDYAVASSARIMMMKAQQQLAKEAQDQALGKEVYKNAAMENTQREEVGATSSSASEELDH